MAGMLGYKRQVIPELRAIIVSAETLHEEWRLAIQETFGVPVYNRYAGRDTHIVAQECNLQKGLHLASEYIYVEVIKEGYPARPGETGEIVITRLDNLAMPFIRYRTGDLGVMSDRVCSCGRGLPLIERVDGRLLDVIKTKNGGVVTGIVFAHLMKDFEEIKIFQLHQMTEDHLVLKLVTDPPGYLSDPEKIERVIKTYIGDTVRIDYEFCDEIPLTPSGKRRMTISHLEN
jgi:phenylacetate-CoA ligase